MKTSLRYILSFLLTAAICITALAGGAYVLYGDYCKRQIEEKFQAQFGNAQSQADQLLESLLQYRLQLFYTLLNGRSELSPLAPPDEITRVSLLSNFESNADVNASLALFFKENPCTIYTSNGQMEYGKYEQRLRDSGISPELSELYSRLLTCTKPIIYSASPNGGQMILILPLGSAWSSNQATLVMILDQSVLSQYFQDIGENTSLYAMDTLGQLALSAPAEGTAALSAQTIYDARTSGIELQEVEGQAMVFLRQASSTGMMTYVGVVPESIFYHGWYVLQNYLLTVVISVVCFSIVLSLIMGYGVYRPVRKAYRLVTGKEGGERAVNELDAIVETFNRTKENVQELEDRQEFTLSLIRHQFTLGLINSTIKTPQEIEAYRDSLRMTLDRPLWLALFLIITGDAQTEAADKLLHMLEDWHSGEAELLFAECRWEKGIGLVLNYGGEHETQTAQSLTQELYEWLARRFGGAVLLAAGSAESSPLAMGISFYRATALAKRAHEEGATGRVVWQTQAALASHLSLDTALLAEGITYGNNEVAQAALKELMQRVESSHEVKPLIRLMCSDMLNTIVLYAQKQGLHADRVLLCQAMEFRTLDEFHDKASELIAVLCAASASMRAQSSMQTRSQVIAFILDNYKRNDLSLKLLSEEMDMSMSKINILLKDNLGCSFVQYVSLLRLNEVKRLLLETNDSIQSIVQSVGYIDVSSFMRKFRQAEGMAPGQYRAAHRKT